MSGLDGLDSERLLAMARAGHRPALGPLLELFRNDQSLMARLQVGRRLQGKIDPADLVQETFLEAHREFHQVRGRSEAELVRWLRPKQSFPEVARRMSRTEDRVKKLGARALARLRKSLESDPDRA